MKISIVTVCKNAKSLISKTIESVFSQNYRNIEYIVIDGDSTDGTLEILNKYEINAPSSVVFRKISEPDGGIYDAMNKGVHLATGNIITFLNAEDYYLDATVVSGVMKHIADYPDFSIYTGGILAVSNDRKRASLFQPFSCVVDRYYFFWETLPHPATFYRKEVFERCGLFDPTFVIAGDYEHFVRCFVKYQVPLKKINEYLVWYNLDGVSTDPRNVSLSLRERDFVRNRYFTWWERILFSARIPEKGRIGRLLRKILRKMRKDPVAHE